ncbi:diguanylate cyclase [Roseofilum sp. BLCC_M154]|uniref:Diguanylate cyclase n=1 Tax=Roseofilum acuticapitatum BLCC-M154 TaxID=3022444 RepID=A0ABT7AX93_9CYAN|nr:GGDEF domain-containing protein [Roseofilum acuticapitatum]MDJ1171485.1 diguanylate cyclase [Roseofilum acuticapitatum BLCC-M154]
MTAEISPKSTLSYSGTLTAMNISSQSLHQYQKEIEKLRQEMALLKQEKHDLEILLENTVDHADTVETLLHESNRKLRAEILERKQIEKELQRSQTELQRLLEIVSRDKEDLEIILETITEHGDFIEEQTHKQSIHDALTHLYNRQYLEEVLDRELDRADRYHSNLGFVMIDIDYFKVFNDTFGHDAGDKVLQAVGQCLQEQVKEKGVAFRYGGEELTLVLPHHNLEQTAQLAEHIRQAVKNIEVHHQEKLLAPVTISLGVACYPIHGPTPTELMKAADLALYQAKNQGRDRVILAH